MCSVITHPVVPVAISVLFPEGTVSKQMILAGAICSIIPDLDVIGFRFGVRYGDLLGHRGLTHSILFAAALGALLTFTLFHSVEVSRLTIFLFLFLSTLSHPVLDAMTNGGLGVALFAPFSNERYFFPWRPIEVSPIGVSRFFSPRGLEVMLSELGWVWLPASVLYVIGQIVKWYR